MRTIKHIPKPKTDTIYIIGTGPSLRLYPYGFFDDKYTIGLNQAYKLFDQTLSLTIHPYLIPVDHTQWNTVWVTKEKPHDPKYMDHMAVKNYERFILFVNSEDFNVFSQGSKENQLYVGRGIHTGAIHLACILGAKYIILVGCDFCALDGYHHSLDQHTEFHGKKPQDVYNEYYLYADKCRRLAKQYWNAEIFSMSPLLGLIDNVDVHILTKQKNLPPLEEPHDIEVTKRITPLVTDYIP